jgi:hypothetical protein
MKKPSLPSKPIEPKIPLREYDKIFDCSINVSSGYTLDEVLKKAFEQSRYFHPDMQPTEQEIKSFKLVLEAGYHSEDSWELKLVGTITRRKILSDKEWKSAEAKYQVKLMNYQIKLERYNYLIKRYTKNMFEWECQENDRKQKEELALLENLKKKYNK